MKAVIGFDTSCYTTSVALVNMEGQVLLSCRKLLQVVQGQRGLRQSDGVFLHVRQMAPLVEEVFKAYPGIEIAGVGVASKPRDDQESYMPVFLVGDAHGRALASALGVPVFSFSHQQGHISAARIHSGLEEKQFLALHLSGGTTEMVEMKDEVITLLGGSKDLHAGQLIDRVGVKLGLPFPAGPSLEKLAMEGESHALLPASMAEKSLWCHLSGAETQLIKWIDEGMAPPNVARECFDFLSRTIAKLVLAGVKETNLHHVLVAGGVASSVLFRQLLIKRLEKADHSITSHFGKPEYSGDNAAGIALLALRELRKG